MTACSVVSLALSSGHTKYHPIRFQPPLATIDSTLQHLILLLNWSGDTYALGAGGLYSFHWCTLAVIMGLRCWLRFCWSSAASLTA